MVMLDFDSDSETSIKVKDWNLADFGIILII